MSKNTAFTCIVSIGFTTILLLWLPLFATNIKNIVTDTSSSTSQITKDLGTRSGKIFGDTGKKIKEKLQELEKEKQEKRELQEKVTEILKENVLSVSSSETVAAPILLQATSSPTSTQLIEP